MVRLLAIALLLLFILLCCAPAAATESSDDDNATEEAKNVASTNECASLITSVVMQQKQKGSNADAYDQTYIKEVAECVCLNKTDATPLSLVMAVVDVESGWLRLTNEKNRQSVGPMQVLSSHAKEYGLDREQLQEVSNNVRVGVAILRECLSVAHGNKRRALTYYNGSKGKETYAVMVLFRAKQYDKLLADASAATPTATPAP